MKMSNFKGHFQMANPLSANLKKKKKKKKTLSKWSKTQTIRRLLLTNCLSVFDHFWGLARKGLISIKQEFSNFVQRFTKLLMQKHTF